MAIYASDDIVYTSDEYASLIATGTTSGYEIEAVSTTPYTSAYGDGAAIASALHPFDGRILNLHAKCVGSVPDADSAGAVSILVYSNYWDADTQAMTDDLTLFATYGPFNAAQISQNGGVVLDAVLPNGLGGKIRVDVNVGTAFTTPDGAEYDPGIDVQIEEYSTVGRCH